MRLVLTLWRLLPDCRDSGENAKVKTHASLPLCRLILSNPAICKDWRNRSTFVDDFEGVSVWIEYVGCVISWIVFDSGPRRNIVPPSSCYRGLIKVIDLTVALGLEPPMKCLWSRLTLLEPEECSLAITKSPQIGMAVLSLERKEKLDVERRQACFIKRQRAFDIAYSQDDMVNQFFSFRIRRVGCLLCQQGSRYKASAGICIPQLTQSGRQSLR